MPRDRQVIGPCPKCQGELSCSYNTFQNGPERIDSWEHRCRDCSYRETKAFRSTDGPAGEDPSACPFCGRKAPG